MAKFLIIAGIILLVTGLIMLFAPRFPFPGRLPGDIVIDKGNFKMFIPITTSILISIVLSLILYFINKAK
jgi:hypothetical protein